MGRQNKSSAAFRELESWDGSVAIKGRCGAFYLYIGGGGFWIRKFQPENGQEYVNKMPHCNQETYADGQMNETVHDEVSRRQL